MNWYKARNPSNLILDGHQAQPCYSSSNRWPSVHPSDHVPSPLIVINSIADCGVHLRKLSATIKKEAEEEEETEGERTCKLAQRLTISVVHDYPMGWVVIDTLRAWSVHLAVALQHVVPAAVGAAGAVLVRVRTLEGGAPAGPDLVLAAGRGLVRVVAVGLALAPEFLWCRR